MNLKLTELVNHATRSQIKYSELMPDIIKFIDKGSTNDCRIVVDSIKEVINEKKSTPSQKLLALELLQGCMLLNKLDFIKTVESRMITFLSKLAEKDSSTLFKDSLETKESEQASERFLHKLLNYIYIWANEFSYTGQQQNEFAKAFYKLREIVTFPTARTRGGSRSATIPPSPINKPKPGMTLKAVIGMLDLLESMDSPETSEAGSEMIDSLNGVIPSLEATLQKANDTDDKVVKKNVNNVLNRVYKVCGKGNNRLSVPVPLNAFGISEALVLDLSFSSATQRCESRPTVLASPSFERSGSFVDKSALFVDNEMRLENENLKKIIEEKEFAISVFESNTAQLQSQVKELESAVGRYQELLKAKEIECAYLLKRVKGESVENGRNEIDFRLACCDKSKLLLENSNCFINFEGELIGNYYKLMLKLLNISGFAYRNLEFEVESAFGFDIKLKKVKKNDLPSCEEFVQELLIQNLCITDTVPMLSVKFEINNSEFQYQFKAPVTVCRFCEEVKLDANEIWNEFELLAFESDSVSVKCDFSLRRCRKLMKLSKSVEVYSKSSLGFLHENYVLAVFGFSKRVYGLVTVNQIDKVALIEVRSESIAIRKSVLGIIVNQIRAS